MLLFFLQFVIEIIYNLYKIEFLGRFHVVRCGSKQKNNGYKQKAQNCSYKIKILLPSYNLIDMI